jgi:nucleoside-diphosphate-sugar epimerase
MVFHFLGSWIDFDLTPDSRTFHEKHFKVLKENPFMKKIVLLGGAGLVGQNLVVRLQSRGYTNIVVLDKHRVNLAILQQLHPGIIAECVDLSMPGEWQGHFEGADAIVMLQAQIGGLDYRDFARNNIDSTRWALESAKTYSVPYLVHISSSVVESVADDFYTRTKRAQEDMVAECSTPHVILRPTLMFGWFDRKHLGWLSRFMKRVPVFPIPGDGRFMRQPLYAGDFCAIIASCIEHKKQGGVYNISGHEKIDYIDVIREIKQATRSKSIILRVPYGLFYALLWTWGLFDKNPPFTTQQLAALIAKDEFEIIDWPTIFGVSRTPFAAAIHETFNDPRFNQVVLEF